MRRSPPQGGQPVRPDRIWSSPDCRQGGRGSNPFCPKNFFPSCVGERDYRRTGVRPREGEHQFYLTNLIETRHRKCADAGFRSHWYQTCVREERPNTRSIQPPAALPAGAKGLAAPLHTPATPRRALAAGGSKRRGVSVHLECWDMEDV